MITLFSALGGAIGAVFAISVMLYVAMATPMGPWIETTVALIALIPLRFLCKDPLSRMIVLVGTVVGSGIAGIIATACSFSLPAIGFIEQDFFGNALAQPLSFLLLMAGLVGSGGLLGLSVAQAVRRSMLEQEKLPFPLGSLVYETLVAGEGLAGSMQLMAGGVIAALCALCASLVRFLPSMMRVVFNFVRLDIAPIFVAVGFIAGPSLILPLVVGVISRYVIIDPFRAYYLPGISAEQFLLSFFTGMVLYGAFYSIGSALISALRSHRKYSLKNWRASLEQYESVPFVAGAAILSIFFFVWQGLSILAALLVVSAAILSAQQLALIAGRIGIAPLGRYATFVMVPALLIFQVTPLQATLIATYIEIAGGVTADALFGYKLGMNAQQSNRKILLFQIVGLLSAALICGWILLLLIKAFGLGSPELFALKARNRAWLITAYSFDWRLIIVGALFAVALSILSINPVLVLGGLAMPIDASLMLAAGGAATYLFEKPGYWYPLWSGIFALSSIGMILKALLIIA